MLQQIFKTESQTLEDWAFWRFKNWKQQENTFFVTGKHTIQESALLWVSSSSLDKSRKACDIFKEH